MRLVCWSSITMPFVLKSMLFKKRNRKKIYKIESFFLEDHKRNVFFQDKIRIKIGGIEIIYPIVGRWFSVNFSSQKLNNKHVLPVPLSPKITIFFWEGWFLCATIHKKDMILLILSIKKSKVLSSPPPLIFFFFDQSPNGNYILKKRRFYYYYLLWQGYLLLDEMLVIVEVWKGMTHIFEGTPLENFAEMNVV